MKLKKIASLMLAGVMAVSMLAGCSTASNGGNNGNDGEGENTAVSGGISAGVGAKVNDIVKDWDDEDKDFLNYVRFKDDAQLASDLKTVVEYAGVMDVMPDYLISDQLNDVQDDVAERYYTQIGKTDDDLWIYNIGNQDKLKEAENLGSSMPSATTGVMKVVSGAIGADAVNTLVAEFLMEKGINDYLFSTSDEEDSAGSNYNHEYTISVSTYSKAVNSSMAGVGVNNGAFTGIIGGAADPYVTFVAIQVVRTSTHQ